MPKPCGIFFKALIVPHYFGFHFYNLFKNFTFVHLTFYALFWRINWLLGIFFAVIFFPYSIKQDTKSLLGINEKFLVRKYIHPKTFKRVVFSICKLQTWAVFVWASSLWQSTSAYCYQGFVHSQNYVPVNVRGLFPLWQWFDMKECAIFLGKTVSTCMWLSTAHPEIVFIEIYSACSAAASLFWHRLY